LVAQRLLSDDMFTGWGVRTLAASMTAYNPMSYHNGSVWPHDNALIVAGLMRYGLVDAAQQVAEALLDAADAFDGRLPELFCGFSRDEYPHPVPFPTSCSPQAWASAAPVQLLRSLLRLDPDLPSGTVWFAPALLSRFGEVVVSGLPVGSARAKLLVLIQGQAAIEGLAGDVRTVLAPMPRSSDFPDPHAIDMGPVG
jgi:glycogen debranching enzyme